MKNEIDTLERFVEHLTRGFTPELAKHFAELPQPNPDFGEYRVVYDIEDSVKILWIIRNGHRKEVFLRLHEQRFR